MNQPSSSACVGPAQVERVLGEGGMGVVYLVRDEQVAGETFAIKVLKEAL
jgi:serine/threonine protein kinase